MYAEKCSSRGANVTDEYYSPLEMKYPPRIKPRIDIAELWRRYKDIPNPIVEQWSEHIRKKQYDTKEARAHLQRNEGEVCLQRNI